MNALECFGVIMEDTTLVKPAGVAPMSVTLTNLPTHSFTLPDHNQLPKSDGTFVKNFQEHPQSIVLTSSILPVLDQLHPDGCYCIGQDSGIYWRMMEPPEKGAEAPDWFYVPNVPPLLDGEYRRSYVLWKEFIAPLIAIEFVSGNGAEERDTTPPTATTKAGKFWVYEQAIRIPFYVIFDGRRHLVEVYQLVNGRYVQMTPNERGRFAIPPLGVEIGLQFENDVSWLRWWDQSGDLLLTGDERAVLEKEARLNAEAFAEAQKALADQERQQKEKLANYLRSMGIDPEAI
jgi:Uma2 family endonuclease